MKKTLLFLALISFCFSGNSQEYQFEPIIDLEATDVISQGRTGTCWSFSTSSFLESEITRKTGKTIDLSEMYNVRHTYPKKAWIYVMRQGKAQFSEGGLAHDVINSINSHGLVPNQVFTGLDPEEKSHNHSKMVDTLKNVLNTYLKNSKDPTLNWNKDVNSILDSYLGKDISTFNYEGVQYTPQTFLEMTTLNPDDYVTITSFMHQPYHSSFILNIPDNFSNGSFYNVSLDEMMQTMDNALKNGYTIELDCDVSEKTFSSKNGVAVIPDKKEHNQLALNSPQKEKEITAAYRQQEFENYHTTDDHLMHITGKLKDQNGTVYYKVKNSWGKKPERVANGGYVYMSDTYMRLKTISIMVHKDAVPNDLKKKLNL